MTCLIISFDNFRSPDNLRDEDLSKNLMELHLERIQRWNAPLIQANLSSIQSE